MSEQIILTNLLVNEEYTRKVLPFLKSSYFHEPQDKRIFTAFVKYYEKYNAAPTRAALMHEITEAGGLSETEFSETIERVKLLKQDDKPDSNWLVDTTESFCQDKAIYNAIMDSISIIDGTDKKNTKHGIPDILKEALAVTFDSHVGHDYFDDAERRYEFYNLEHEKIKFDLEMFNKITNGGIPRKTLNIILAGTNVGKTLAMVHLASSYVMNGYNVLYITLEMAEEMISNRVDANLLDMTVNEVEKVDKERFFSGINKLKSKTHGKLVVKEYPTSSAHVGHFRQLMQELQMKRSFKPDIIFIDYIGIMASARVKLGGTNSYGYIKAIAEELRGFAVEFNVPVWSAVQSNRSGYSDTDVDLTNTAESFGLPATADFMFALIRTSELDQMGQLMVKQLKSRYGNKGYYEKFVVGVDPDRMKLYDVEMSAQKNIIQSDGSKHDDIPDKPLNRFGGKNSGKKFDDFVFD